MRGEENTALVRKKGWWQSRFNRRTLISSKPPNHSVSPWQIFYRSMQDLHPTKSQPDTVYDGQRFNHTPLSIPGK